MGCLYELEGMGIDHLTTVFYDPLVCSSGNDISQNGRCNDHEKQQSYCIQGFMFFLLRSHGAPSLLQNAGIHICQKV